MAGISRNHRRTRGVTMVEYAVLLALIALVSFGVVSALGGHVKGAFQSVGCAGSGQGNNNGNGGGNGGGIGGGSGGGRCQGAAF
jgi:Flp pilus assembly pilin Flp